MKSTDSYTAMELDFEKERLSRSGRLLSLYRIGHRLLDGTGIARFYPVRVIEQVLSNKLYSRDIKVLGHKMVLTPNSLVSHNIIAYGLHEPFETELVIKEIRKGDHVLDLGANIGYYTLIFAECVGKTGKVFAFEPVPRTFALLKKNVQMNQYKNVIMVQKAVSDKSGKTNLYVCEKQIGESSIYKSNVSGQSTEVATIRLDDYFKDYDGKIDFIKMDIERAEMSAIQGMQSLLERNKKLKIVTEFNPPAMEESGFRPEELPEMLQDYGFKLYNISEREKKIEAIDTAKLSEMTADMMENFRTRKPYSYTNLLCIRQ